MEMAFVSSENKLPFSLEKTGEFFLTVTLKENLNTFVYKMIPSFTQLTGIIRYDADIGTITAILICSYVCHSKVT